jgi:hypothetical protein
LLAGLLLTNFHGSYASQNEEAPETQAEERQADERQADERQADERQADERQADEKHDMSAIIAPLEPLRWKRRVLVVAEPEARAQGEEAAPGFYESDGQPGLDDRRVTRIALDASDTLIAEPPLGFEVDAPALRRALDLPRAGFQVVLIGLDGTVKQRWDSLPEAEDLFSIIDAMPMRQRELKEREEAARKRDRERQLFEQ